MWQIKNDDDDDDDDDCPFSFTSHSCSVVFVQGGVVIVDSPGIGDSEQVNNITLKYLAQAYAFIYVINSANAGGIQEDRVCFKHLKEPLEAIFLLGRLLYT